MDNATCLGNRIAIWLPPQVNLESQPLKAPANKTYLIDSNIILNKYLNKEIFNHQRNISILDSRKIHEIFSHIRK
jgi:hypothetical protein